MGDLSKKQLDDLRFEYEMLLSRAEWPDQRGRFATILALIDAYESRERDIAAAVQAEREACAEVVESLADAEKAIRCDMSRHPDTRWAAENRELILNAAFDLIRARGGK